MTDKPREEDDRAARAFRRGHLAGLKVGLYIVVLIMVLLFLFWPLIF